MTPEQKAAYVMAMAAAAHAEVEAMRAENMQREMRGESMAYNDEAFIALIERYGIHPNAIMTFFEDNQ